MYIVYVYSIYLLINCETEEFNKIPFTMFMTSQKYVSST